MNNSLLKCVLKHWQLYLFLILPITYIVIFAYIPMVGVQIAFKKFDPNMGIWGSPWLGFDHFERFFQSYQFVRVLTNTLSVSVYGLFVGFPIPIVFALLLNALKNDVYRKFIQNITYIPHFISTIVMVGMVMQVFNPRIGLIGYMGNLLGMEVIPNFMASSKAFPHVYVWSGIWQNMGWSTIIYIAALSSTDPELHQSMKIDGATRFQRLLNLELPCIMPTATILLILDAGKIMNIGFEKVLLMQNSMNISASEVISTYVYKVGLTGASANFSYATAIGLFNSAVNFALIIMVNFIARRNNGTSLW